MPIKLRLFTFLLSQKSNFKPSQLFILLLIGNVLFMACSKSKDETRKSITAKTNRYEESLPYNIIDVPTITDPIAIAVELGFKEVEKISENEIRYKIWVLEDEEEEWSYLKKISDSVFLHQNEGSILYEKLVLEDSLQWKVYTRIDENGNETEYSRLKYTMEDHHGYRYFRRGNWGISWTSILWLYCIKDDVVGKELPAKDLKWLHTIYVGFRKPNAKNDLPKIAYESIMDDYKYSDEQAEYDYQKILKTETELFTLYGLVVDHDNYWEADY